MDTFLDWSQLVFAVAVCAIGMATARSASSATGGLAGVAIFLLGLILGVSAMKALF